MNGQARGMVAVVLASAIALSVVALSVAAAWAIGSNRASPLDTEAATLLSTAFGATVGAVATYLGGRSHPPETEAPPSPTENEESSSLSVTSPSSPEARP